MPPRSEAALQNPQNRGDGLLADLFPEYEIGIGGSRHIAGFLAEITAEIERRQASGAPMLRPWYLIVHGLHAAPELCASEPRGFGSRLSTGGEQEPPTPAEQFAAILQRGPAVGVHCLTWCDTGASVEQALRRIPLSVFNARIIFQTDRQDSMRLISQNAGVSLPEHRALLYTEDDKKLQTFRPYTLPSDEWLQEIARTLSDRLK